MPDMHSIHGHSSLVVAVGDAGTIWHLTPTGFSVPPRATTAQLLAVCIRHPADGWAAGLAGTLLHWDGAAWTALDSGTTADLVTIAATPTETWIGGRLALLRWSPTAGITSIRTDAVVNSIYIDDAGHVFCLCADKAVYRFDSPQRSGAPSIDGRRWRRDVLPGDDEEDEFCQLAGCGHGPVYAAGMRGQLYRFDGQGWQPVPVHTNENFIGAACRRPDELWLTTHTGQLLCWDGQQLRTRTTSPFGWLAAVCAPAGDDTVYCAGKAGTVLRYRTQVHHPASM